MHNWLVYDDFDTASNAAANFIADNIKDCLLQRDICHVALPGGNSPVKCLGYLAAKDIPWHKVHWYLGDERCYPIGHAERNDLMLDKYFWSLLGKTNIHRMPAESGAEKAAEHYREEIAAVDYFDIVFLGVGEDGHTASLFPDNAALDDSRTVIPVHNSPKPPSDRVSLSQKTLATARCRIVIACGSEKAPIIKRIKEGEPLPINSIGDINWFIDRDALSAVSM